jgi:hypothetical protein
VLASGTLFHHGLRARQSGPFQPFCQQAQTVTGGPEEFNLSAVATPEDKNVARQRIIFQRSLHFGGQTIEAVPHVGDTITTIFGNGIEEMGVIRVSRKNSL